MKPSLAMADYAVAEAEFKLASEEADQPLNTAKEPHETAQGGTVTIVPHDDRVRRDGGLMVQSLNPIKLFLETGGHLAATQNAAMTSRIHTRKPITSSTTPAIIPADQQGNAGEPGEFYIIGEVTRPGVYSLNGRKLTLKQALAATGVKQEDLPRL